MEYKASQELLLDSEDPEVRPLFFCLEVYTLGLPWSKYELEDPEVRLRVFWNIKSCLVCYGNFDKYIFICGDSIFGGGVKYIVGPMRIVLRIPNDFLSFWCFARTICVQGGWVDTHHFAEEGGELAQVVLIF